jgi:hypothetical protein
MVDNVDVSSDTQVTETVPPISPSKERVSVRESLERTFDDARRTEETEEREPRQRRQREREEDTGKFVRGDESTRTERTEEPPEQTETEESETQTPVTSTAPSAWSKEAKAKFAELPSEVQQAVIKREADVDKGVKELKSKYEEMDRAVAPHIEEIKRFGKTPGQAVAQLFSWFEAFAKNPDQAFPALIQAYNYDPRKIAQVFGLNQQAPPPQQTAETQEAEPEDDIPTWAQSIKSELAQFKQHQSSLQQSFAEQSMAKTNELLDQWAKDKPHFNEVRQFMGHLLTPDPNTGAAAVPLKDGRVDLDTAYDMAVYANPNIRSKVLAEQGAKIEADKKAKRDAEAKAQDDQAKKARAASGSLSPSSPGAEASRKQKSAKGKSVRESLRDSISELNS